MENPKTVSVSVSIPTVSVCIPVFNGEKYLQEALDSVLQQSYSDFEVIVRDDVSTDRSWGILESIHDPRVKVFRNSENLGAEQNWNRVVGEARGQYVKLFHQDDLLESDCLERQVAAMDAHPECSMVFSGRSIIRGDGKVIVRIRSPWKVGLVSRHQVIRSCVSSGTNRVGEPSVVLFRKAAFVDAGGFDGTVPYTIDLDLWDRLLTRGPGFSIPDTLVRFRVSPGQWSMRIGKQQGSQFREWVDRLESNGFALSFWNRIRARLLSRIHVRLRRMFAVLMG